MVSFFSFATNSPHTQHFIVKYIYLFFEVLVFIVRNLNFPWWLVHEALSFQVRSYFEMSLAFRFRSFPVVKWFIPYIRLFASGSEPLRRRRDGKNCQPGAAAGEGGRKARDQRRNPPALRAAGPREPPRVPVHEPHRCGLPQPLPDVPLPGQLLHGGLVQREAKQKKNLLDVVFCRPSKKEKDGVDTTMIRLYLETGLISLLLCSYCCK